MLTLIVDENLPRDLAPALRQLGYAVKDVRDYNLRGRPDDEIYEFAQREQAVLISSDLGFADIVRFPLGTHHGIIVVRLPNELPADLRVRRIVQALTELRGISLQGSLAIVSLSGIRIRRATRV